MKTLFVLLIGAVLGVGAYIYFKDHQRGDLDQTGTKISESAGNLKEKVSDAIPNLDTKEIKAEMERTGQVVRKKAEEAGSKISDVASDTRITSEIKGKFAVDSELSALKISVNTTDGVVTLSGTAPSHDAVKKAMRTSLEIPGVKQVISTLQVKR